MLSNFHTHTTFCDGKNTPEEVVLAAIEKGFTAIGFSGHAYAPFSLSYCITDTQGYKNEVNRLKEKYKKDIQIYLGVEEDAFYPSNRNEWDYIIGSSHYFIDNGKYYAIDSSPQFFKTCLELFDYDIPRLATSYYASFCDYIKHRKPDIIGHFDLITKYDELDTQLFLNNAEYHEIAKKYISQAALTNCIFELNTGAISRGLRKTPYPYENLLHILKKANARIILSSDSHAADTLDFNFKESKKLLSDVGFKQLYTLYNGEFVKYDI